MEKSNLKLVRWKSSRRAEVAIRGMIIIAGTLSVAHQPLSVFLVKVFSYVWTPTTILRFGVFLQMMEKHGVWQCRGKLWRTVIDIGKGCERLTRGKGPDGTVPFAGGLAWLVSLAKQRMAPLCRRHAERCFETLAVQQLQPRWSIAQGVIVRHIHIPRQEAYKFSHLGKGVCHGERAEGFQLPVPQFGLYKCFQAVCFHDG